MRAWHPGVSALKVQGVLASRATVFGARIFGKADEPDCSLHNPHFSLVQRMRGLPRISTSRCYHEVFCGAPLELCHEQYHVPSLEPPSPAYSSTPHLSTLFDLPPEAPDLLESYTTDTIPMKYNAQSPFSPKSKYATASATRGQR
jgi:hypothetical protein